MNEGESLCIGQQYNSSSWILGVEREDLLWCFDFQCTLLGFFRPMIPMVSKIYDFYDHWFIV